jgi:aldose sugar dehydrogenase
LTLRPRCGRALDPRNTLEQPRAQGADLGAGMRGALDVGLQGLKQDVRGGRHEHPELVGPEPLAARPIHGQPVMLRPGGVMRRIHGLLAFLLPLTTPSFLAAQSLRDPSLKVEHLVSGLNSPTTMAFIGPGDILVLQKNDGKVRRIIGGVLQPGHVLDVAVDNASERGLLGIAVHPQFPSTPSIYLYFTQSSTGSDTSGSPPPLWNRVYRYTWNGAALTNPTPIVTLPVTPGPNHDGGIISFGPDGKLYVVIGDLNRNGQLQNFPTGPAPDNTGVILRLNANGSVPTDNPFFSQGGNLAKYYAYGLRNSFGLAFDPVTERLWMTENGPNVYDEINMVEPGFNSGWERILGPNSRDPQGTSDLFSIPGSHYSDPEFSWLDPVAPTALVFLHSTDLGPQYENDLLAADFITGTLYRFELNAARDGLVFQSPGLADLVADNAAERDAVIFGTGFGHITDLKPGPDGLLYVLSFGGSIYVMSPTMAVGVGEVIMDNAPAGQSGMGEALPAPGVLRWLPIQSGQTPSTVVGPDWTPTAGRRPSRLCAPMTSTCDGRHMPTDPPACRSRSCTRPAPP